MQVSKTGVNSVDALYGVIFTGNIIPNSWYSTIRTEKGKPDLTAITILSEILYWHRPREECDESDAGGIKLIKREILISLFLVSGKTFLEEIQLCT